MTDAIDPAFVQSFARMLRCDWDMMGATALAQEIYAMMTDYSVKAFRGPLSITTGANDVQKSPDIPTVRQGQLSASSGLPGVYAAYNGLTGPYYNKPALLIDAGVSDPTNQASNEPEAIRVINGDVILSNGVNLNDYTSGSASSTLADIYPVGSKILWFDHTSIPSGWSLVATYNNKFLKISNAGLDTGVAVDTGSENSHTHTIAINSHTHNVSTTGNLSITAGTAVPTNAGLPSSTGGFNCTEDHSHSLTWGGTITPITAITGGTEGNPSTFDTNAGSSHQHTAGEPAYVSVCIIQRNS